MTKITITNNIQWPEYKDTKQGLVDRTFTQFANMNPMWAKQDLLDKLQDLYKAMFPNWETGSENTPKIKVDYWYNFAVRHGVVREAA